VNLQRKRTELGAEGLAGYVRGKVGGYWVKGGELKRSRRKVMMRWNDLAGRDRAEDITGEQLVVR